MQLRKYAFVLLAKMQNWIVPELRYSQAHYEDCLREYVAGAQIWLDVGCGHQLLPPWRFSAECDLINGVPLVVGIDPDRESLLRHRTIKYVVCADISSLPFNDDTFDLVTANMVVEHLSDPSRQLSEVARVLRPGGVFLFHTPNAESYVIKIARLLPQRVKKVLARVLEGRAESDVFPTFYLANTAASINQVALRANLEVTSLNFIGTSPVFSVVPPLAALELLWIRQIMRRSRLSRYRQTLICTFRRPWT